MLAYRNALNSMITDIWNSIEWKDKRIRRKKQIRIIPFYNRSNEFKKRLRDKHLENWPFAAHWVDSALKTAYSIIDSWRRNYVKGKRKGNKPAARGLFLRVKQTLPSTFFKCYTPECTINNPSHQHGCLTLCSELRVELRKMPPVASQSSECIL